MTATAAPGEQWTGVSPKYLWVDLVERFVPGAIVTAALCLPPLLSRNPWLWPIPGAAFAILVLVLAFTPRRVRAIRFALRDDDLLFRRGIMWRRVVAVPYGRMQLVDIRRGPVARALGLAELRFVTAAAGTGVTIPGLPAVDAEELRDRLVALAESRRAAL